VPFLRIEIFKPLMGAEKATGRANMRVRARKRLLLAKMFIKKVCI
jgi:hypothetical protein